MLQVAQQLARVRATGRFLLILRRLAQCLAILLPVMVILGLIDYLLRLPWQLRLGIGVILLGLALYWLATRLYRAVRFSPTIPELALRAERVYPQLAGSFASAVEFSLASDEYASPATTAGMAQSAIAEMQSKLGQVNLNRLLRFSPTVWSVLLALLSVMLLGAVVAAAPTASATAASRWLNPLGGAEWPKRNHVELGQPQPVYAVGAPIQLSATVTQGPSDDLPMTIRYRIADAEGEAGQWQTVLGKPSANDAATNPGFYKAQIDIPAQVARSLMAGRRDSAVLEVTYTAGDFTTEIQELVIAARPEVAGVTASITPPRYAQGLVSGQTIALHEQADRMASCSAYLGSTVNLRVELNKPLPETAVQDVAEKSGLPQDAEIKLTNENGLITGFSAKWTLTQDVVCAFVLTDSFGLSSTDSDRMYRVQAREDEPPRVVLLGPAIDESVLPTALVNLSATSEDDIAMQSLRLDVQVPDRDNTPEDAEQVATRLLKDPALLTTNLTESISLDHTIQLNGLGLIPGDEVLITAIGKDVYAGEDLALHEVSSETRRLRVITEQELADQVRRVLSGIRNTAQTLERNQRLVAERTERGDPSEAAGQQGDLTRRIAAQSDQLDAVRERLSRNAPENLEGLERLLDRAEGLLDNARQASEQAEQDLQDSAAQSDQAEAASQAASNAREQAEAAEAQGDPAQAQDQQQQAEQSQQEAAEAAAEAQQSREEAGENQERTQRQLGELVAALDMGESVGEVESELSSILDEAERLAQDTRELLPRTVGREREDLPEEVRGQLDEAAERQQELAERAEALVDKMRQTAAEVGEQGQTPEQRATAKTLEEAAAVAERQGLEENTEEAAENLEENQVADAATQQQQSISTLQQMMAELGKQQDRRQEELQRLLTELAEKIQKLVTDQEAELARAEQAQADALAALEQPLFELRRRVMLVEAEANESTDTVAVVEPLGWAVRRQAEAIKAIRAQDKQATVAAETEALAQLRRALEQINEQQQDMADEQQRQERLQLRQAYYDLAEKQEQLTAIVGQHLSDESYSRRDWRQINGLHEEALEEAEFDEVQEAIRAKAKELSEQIGEAMVYQSTHRRIDQSAARAENRLSTRTIDELVISDQVATAQLLRTMGDAMDDAALEEKFEQRSEQQDDSEGGSGESGSNSEDPPLVPDLAEIKLLRELMISVKDQTAELDGLAEEKGTEAYQQRLAELAQTQQELGDLGQYLLDKLREQMQPPVEEERN
ncbi:MAG: hypothetical protein AAGH88_00975 [Planctomycetota bacterium]